MEKLFKAMQRHSNAILGYEGIYESDFRAIYISAKALAKWDMVPSESPKDFDERSERYKESVQCIIWTHQSLTYPLQANGKVGQSNTKT